LKLNHDCVRDTLLYLEENLKLDDSLNCFQISIPKYNSEDIVYTIQKLSDGNLINVIDCSTLGGYSCIITSLTFKGHEYLDNIRDSKVWKQTKSIISKIASVSLDVTSKVAAQVVSNILTGG